MTQTERKNPVNQNGPQKDDQLQEFLAKILTNMESMAKEIAEDRYPGYMKIAEDLKNECSPMINKFAEWMEADEWIGSEIHFLYVAANVLSPIANLPDVGPQVRECGQVLKVTQRR